MTAPKNHANISVTAHLMSVSSGGVESVVNHDHTSYVIAAGSATTFADKVFTGDTTTSTVCRLVSETTRHAVAEGDVCAESAAFTSWQVPRDMFTTVYGADGNKTAAWKDAKLDVKTAMPHFKPTAGTRERDTKDVQRFISMLAHHERGHVQTGEIVFECIREFLHELPDHIDASKVAEYNATVRGVCDTFIAQGHKADVKYDKYTGHGFTQGAIASGE